MAGHRFHNHWENAKYLIYVAMGLWLWFVYKACLNLGVMAEYERDAARVRRIGPIMGARKSNADPFASLSVMMTAYF